MSMSIMIDKKYRNRNKNNQTEHTPTLQPLIWVSDDKVDKCHKCDISFSFINRRHHCRLCGRIFLWILLQSICGNTQSIGTITDQSWWFYESNRMCQTCYSDVEIIHNFPSEFYMFLEIPLTIKEIFQLKMCF